MIWPSHVQRDKPAKPAPRHKTYARHGATSVRSRRSTGAGHRHKRSFGRNVATECLTSSVNAVRPHQAEPLPRQVLAGSFHINFRRAILVAALRSLRSDSEDPDRRPRSDATAGPQPRRQGGREQQRSALVVFVGNEDAHDLDGEPSHVAHIQLEHASSTKRGADDRLFARFEQQS